MKDSDPPKEAAPAPEPSTKQAPAPTSDEPPKVTPPEFKGPDVEAGKQKQKVPPWKQECINNYFYCQQYKWKGNCYECFRYCEGQRVWPAALCGPQG